MKRSLKQRIADALLVLTAPSCWLQNNPCSEHWDTTLNLLMEKHKFEPHRASHCRAVIGGIDVWIANHPYCSFHEVKGWPIEHGPEFRPSRATILRAWKKLQRDTFKNKIP